jgi:hypothetical protein
MLSFNEYIKESTDTTVHQKLRSLGYKKDTAETSAGVARTWYKHPSGKHPLSTADLAKHLGHTHENDSSHVRSMETRHKETGEWTSIHGQEPGGIVVSTPKKNKQGKMAEKRHSQGYDS